MNVRRPHVCFVAPSAYPVVTGDESIERIGGAQVQQVIIAKALVERGYNVSMICMDHGQDDELCVEGIKIFKAYSPDAGLPIVRFVWPRATTVWRCMERADADIYYYRTAGWFAGLVAAYCKRRGKRSIFAAASDPDLEPNTSRLKYKRDRILFAYGVRRVDQVIVQNEYQRELCKRHYHREPVLINNCWAAAPESNGTAADRILWVSMIRRLKRPELFVELARSLPQYKFEMVGGSTGKEKPLFNEIQRLASHVPNLEFHGFVPLSRTDEFFARARLFVNTSDFEGFPNTFLQAWARGVPTISFVDCGARDADEPIGLSVRTLEQMKAIVHDLMSDQKKWNARSEACSRHFSACHSPTAVVPRYEAVIERLLERRQQRSGVEA